MDKIKITEETFVALKYELSNAIIFETLLDDKLSYNHKITDTVYHYTDLNALINIVEKQTLWATNIKFLNDSKEFTHGVDLMVKNLEEIKTDENNLLIQEIKDEINRIYETDRFVTCFSKEGNLLSQWRAYANNGKGVSIGFNPRMLQSSLQSSLKGKYILYDDLQQNFVIRTFLEKALSFFIQRKNHFDWNNRFEEMAAFAIIEYFEFVISDYKHPAFDEEQEYRLELRIFDFLKEKAIKQINYRSNGTSIIPYVQLETKYGYFNRTKKSDEVEPTFLYKKLPIKEVIIGPSLNFDLVSDGLKKFLLKNGYNDVQIKASGLPYRI